jgi:hydrogenase maturation protein HypF
VLTEKDNTTQLRKSKEVSVTVEIYISGVVQGVGFRPMIYRNAKAHRLNGFVQNSGKGVTIKISGNQASVNGFIESLQKNIPLNASVEAVQINEIPFQSYPSFRIIDSNESSQTPGFKITPDFTLCANCRTELWDKHNRRCRYPFITCTDCGPRYSIIQMLPFDRAHTSMKTFVQCAECLAEYDDEADTRFHAQTNSCKNCGIRLSVYRNGIEQNNPTDEACLAMIQESLKAGETVAVKGIGGFLLMCDASNHKALKRLRERKHRPGKPFAVMFPNIQTIRKMLTISAQEENELLSVARPIVLLNKKEKARQCIVEMVAPGLDTIGAFLPCAPLLELIVQDFSLPLVATSANVSGSGIVYSNDDALKLLPDLCDLIVLHNRDIVIPQDDSVIRFTPEQKQRIVLRNGRGFAPVQFSIPNLRENIFAAGAMLKSTVALASDQKVLISQYIGNTSQYEVQQSYKLVAHHLMKLWHHVPDTWLCDMHPDYFSSNFVAENKNDGLKKSIQHHQAHFAAVLFENKLTDSYTPVLGVVWDGLGLGKDGQIWGGEFFTYKNGAMARACHFEYRPFILGDKMSREPRIAALSLSESEQTSVRKI